MFSPRYVTDRHEYICSYRLVQKKSLGTSNPCTNVTSPSTDSRSGFAPASFQTDLGDVVQNQVVGEDVNYSNVQSKDKAKNLSVVVDKIRMLRRVVSIALAEEMLIFVFPTSFSAEDYEKNFQLLLAAKIQRRTELDVPFWVLKWMTKKIFLPFLRARRKVTRSTWKIKNIDTKHLESADLTKVLLWPCTQVRILGI